MDHETLNEKMLNDRFIIEHTQVADKMQQAIYARMSPAEKWHEVLRMRQSARLLKRAFLKEQNPVWTEEQIEAELKKIFLYASS